MSLKLKLALAVSLIFVLFSFCSGYLALRFFGDAHKKSVHHDLVLLASTLATDIDGRLLIAQNALTAVALNCPPAAFTDPRLAQRFLEQRVTLHSLFQHEIQLLDHRGQLVAEHPFRGGRHGESLAAQSYVRRTLATGHVEVTPLPVADHNAMGLDVMVTAPVVGAKGELVGLLAGRIDPLSPTLHASLFNAALGSAGHLHIVGRDGSFYYHRDATSADNSAPGSNSPSALQGNTLLAQALRDGVAAGENVNCCDQPVIAAFRALDRVGWLVGVCFPRQSVYGLLYAAQHYFILLSCVGLLLLLGTILLVAGRIAGPLTALATHVKRLPSLPAERKRLNTVRGDEIGTLITAFNDMVTEVEEQKSTLREALTRASYEQARTEAIIAAVGDGISILDRSYRILYQNKVHQQLIGNHLGAFCYQAYEGMDRVCVGCPVTRSYADGQIHRAERSIIKDGELQVVDITASPLRDAGGEIVAGIEVVRNVTERKQSEEEIQQLNHVLQERAAELERLTHEQESFSYSLSHDLKNPLAAISTSAEILQTEYSQALDDAGRFVVSAIGRSCERLEEIIDAMLLLNRINRSDLRREVVDLSAMARDVAETVQAGNPDRDVDWQITDGIAVVGDPRLLRSVLENLLGNAWKYTDRTTNPRIAFGMQNNADGTRVYWIRDNGVGFAMSQVESLFQPFKRLHGEMGFAGLGIGLATVQKIIHRHGGRIWAEGVVDQGATFSFTLP